MCVDTRKKNEYAIALFSKILNRIPNLLNVQRSPYLMVTIIIKPASTKRKQCSESML